MLHHHGDDGIVVVLYPPHERAAYYQKQRSRSQDRHHDALVEHDRLKRQTQESIVTLVVAVGSYYCWHTTMITVSGCRTILLESYTSWQYRLLGSKAARKWLSLDHGTSGGEIIMVSDSGEIGYHCCFYWFYKIMNFCNRHYCWFFPLLVDKSISNELVPWNSLPKGLN